MIRIVSILCLSFSILWAENGDTTIVQVHNNSDMTSYGHYKEWGEFPSENSYRKVLMHFTMGCASTGCSGWDYDVHILMRNKTGKIDSHLVIAPNFIIDGSINDSISLSYYPTYVNVWDSINGNTAIANDSLMLVWFENENAPFLATDTQYVFTANYYNPTFDNLGMIVDSSWVSADTSIYLSNTDTYSLFEVIEDFELGRAITPYGTYMNPNNTSYATNGYDENWKHVFTYDVTDFQHLLKDSVEIDAFYSGWSSGFSITLDFEFIEGTPPRMPISLTNVYKNGSNGYEYSSSIDFETNQMPEVKVPTLNNAQNFKLQFVPTGHGSAGEFTPGVGYTVKVNDNIVGGETIWKDDCGFNAIWPQGGTWVFNRANWCPGEAVPIFNHEITPYITAGDTALVDINFSNYIPSDEATYKCAVHFFQYKAPNYYLDAEIIDVIRPSLKDQHLRYNPACSNPVVKIRNSGKEQLTSLNIQYGIKGGTVQTYQWTGSLQFMEEEEVSLGQIINDGSDNIFEVGISSPNGSTDMHADNDFMQSPFQEVPVYKNSFLVRLKTNYFGSQNSWKIENSANQIVYSKDNLESNTLYADTVILANDCYKFTIEDTGNDGLDFWYNDKYGTPDGTGFVNFMYYDTISIFQNFNNDFGSKIVHSFRVENSTSISQKSLKDFQIFPSISKGFIHIKNLNSSSESTEIIVLDSKGQKIFQNFWHTQSEQTTLDLSHLVNGIYFVIIRNSQFSQTDKIIIGSN